MGYCTRTGIGDTTLNLKEDEEVGSVARVWGWSVPSPPQHVAERPLVGSNRPLAIVGLPSPPRKVGSGGEGIGVVGAQHSPHVREQFLVGSRR